MASHPSDSCGMPVCYECGIDDGPYDGPYDGLCLDCLEATASN